MSTLPPLFLTDLDSEDQESAKQIADKWGFTIVSIHPEDLYLTFKQGILAIQDATQPKEGAVYVDFASDALSYRRKHGGGKQESIAKAVGVKGQNTPYVVDATGGLGRDAFVLASLGCKVCMLERSPVVAALLENGLQRAAQEPELQDWLPQNLFLKQGDSIELMTQWEEEKPEVVYLDPMFPHKKKSALVKKEMRLFQKLLGGDADANKLLAPALELANKRVVVKRPSSAPYLADKKPNSNITSKKHRFDLYINP
ncbi:class I SAM-dependent methyltransferase [Paraneptunicella aestuarii]|uniref:class I SAM-dependent methyltransferase n=1 Tax=Paraneptunicella aestuarii TaxID=2831148 RepID=UPI001E3BDAEC|nr:class I SAM-dependent methyltransferase [Paraneptunicella aestuarii]UAA38387.1 class I SAM-dependent methyltransferase [Paraneptunicella aestuarii]